MNDLVRVTYIGGPLNGMQRVFDKDHLPKSPHRVATVAEQGLVVPDNQNASPLSVHYTNYDMWRVNEREMIAVPERER